MSAPLDTRPAKASIRQTIKAVAWSFLGIRRSSEFQADVGRLNPLHVILVGVVGAVIFILSLIALVNWVVAK